MVLIKNDKIPVECVDPLVLCFDQARLFIFAKQVLKGAEINKWLIWVDLICILHRNGIIKLPSIKIDMTSEILVPSILHSWLECHNKNAFGAHSLC